MVSTGDKIFCCQGCLSVFELLTENGLGGFYELTDAAGVQGGGMADAGRFRFADEPAVRQQLVDFSDDRRTRVTFRIPAIHCIACVWLLEHLFRLNSSIGHSEVNFTRKELAVAFDTARISLSDVITLLASLGYEPELRLSDLGVVRKTNVARRTWLQLGVAGFAFGNTMLFSIASYLGLDTASGPGFQRLVGVISLLLAVPVVGYSALDYWRSAWTSLRQRLLNIDVPIAAGIVALFAQSCYEVISGRGEGYFDSLCGLLFFLLCGKLFQQKTFDRLAFDRDYRSFFPLSVTRISSRGEESIALSELGVDDRLLIRNGELIPTDSRLIDGAAFVDYSFVTGEAEPVAKTVGDYLYAGGRQIGGAIQVQIVKRISESYLTSLWNQEAFRKKDQSESLNTLTNRYSQRFTKIVIAIALGAAGFWGFVDWAISLKAFTSVLIVACPCALALAAPFTLGTAQRVLARRGVFLKNAAVIENLAGADAIVFDKTGTLTTTSGLVSFDGGPLTSAETRWLSALARHSTHPYAVRIARVLAPPDPAEPVTAFREFPGAGMEAQVAGHEIWMGSAAWLKSKGAGWQPWSGGSTGAGDGVDGLRSRQQSGSVVHVAIDKQHRGCFKLTSSIRPSTNQLLAALTESHEMALLSGDNDNERERFRRLFGSSAHLYFNQSPLEKLRYVRERQMAGRKVLMVGDGLNDAGALQQSDVGVAVVENLSAFCPASDVIMAADMVPQLGQITRFAKLAVMVVRASFFVSTIYNIVGISIAARGLLAPVVCAVLMPLSSISVVALAIGVSRWLGGQVLPERRESVFTGEAAL